MEMWINLAGMALTGIHGDESGGNLGETGVPRERPAGEFQPKPQTAEPPAAPKLPPQPLSAAERQSLEADIQARRPISKDTLERANASGGADIPKGYVADVANNRLVYKGPNEPAATGSTPSGIGRSNSATTQKVPIQKGEITTYEDFDARSPKGDNLEGHELWQHANLKAQGLATKRLSTEASKQNPVIALDKSTHARVSVAQRSIAAPLQTPAQNIDANAGIMRNLGAADNKAVDRLEQMSKEHSEKYTKPETHEPE